MAYAERRNGKLTGRICADAEHTKGDGVTLRLHKAYRESFDDVKKREQYFRLTGELLPTDSKGPLNSFASVAERFEERHKEYFKGRKGDIRKQRLEFAKTHLGVFDVKAIRYAQLEKYVDTINARCGCAGNPPAPRTVNAYLVIVNKVLRHANKLDLIPGLPEVPRQANVGKESNALSWAQETVICNRLIADGKPDYAFLVRVLAATGMRRGELYSLRPEQIEIPEQVENTGWMLAKERTKTKEARWVPFQPEAARKLKALIASGKMPTAAQLYLTYKETLAELGEGWDFTLHSLRHTTNTRLLECTEKEVDVAVLMGHSTGSMTKHYYHPSRAYLFSVAKKVHTGLGEMPRNAEVVKLETPANRALSA